MLSSDLQGSKVMDSHAQALDQWSELGRVLDNLVAIDLVARGICHQLYDAAVQLSGSPLTTGTALALQERVLPGKVVFICTGWPSRSWLMKGLTETDGPVGAAYLARAIEQCFGAIPVLVVEESLISFAETALRAAGLIVADIETALRSKQGPHKASVAAVLAFTTELSRSQDDARALLEHYSPAAVIAIEIPGANVNGEYHNVTARLVPTELVVKADEIVSAAREAGILTIGIGDGGNELGMGVVRHAVEQYLPQGLVIAPVTLVDHLVVGSISNWAAVGLSAAIAAITDNADLLRTVDLLRITEKVSDAGAIDGLSAYVDPKNDGTSAATSAAFVELVTTSVEMHLKGWKKG
ncbi:MAG TPA: glutamate cyclase domain-containing protein [Candidatus Paceibacterota bacterium]|nr:glutamate cyclase domain-containing protein [Candidatus Paceibacterota bacterium]